MKVFYLLLANFGVFAAPQWSDWTEWTECSFSCGGGTMTRTRTCPGGSSKNPCPKGEKEEIKECQTNLCRT